MIAIHVWNENTAQAGRDAYESRGCDSTAYEFETQEELSAFLSRLDAQIAKAHAGRDIYLMRLRSTLAGYLD